MKGGESIPKKMLDFFNVKTKQKFSTANYKMVKKKGRNFAVAMNKGIECYRIMPK